MSIVKTNRKKIEALEADDVRRLFTRSVNGWLKENERDLIEQPSKEVIAGVVTELTSIWTDAIEIMVDSAVDTVLPVMLGDQLEDDGEDDGEDEGEDDEDDDDDEEKDPDVIDAEVVDE